MVTVHNFEEHRAALTGHCYRMLGSAAEADDAVQETMLRAWRGIEKFDERSMISTGITGRCWGWIRSLRSHKDIANRSRSPRVVDRVRDLCRFLSLLLVALVVWPRPAVARQPALRDTDVVRTDLRTVTVRYQEPKGPHGELIDVARERMVYSASGRLIEHDNRDMRGRIRVHLNYVFDAGGRMTESHYRDHTGRVEIRRYSYKLDAAGRISERDLRNPASPPSELWRDVYTWGPDGSRAVRTYRHYAKEGPYEDGFAAYDATGRQSRHCSSGHCELYEYDAHGEISRVREQNRETHFYRVHENHYDDAGHLIRQRIGGTETVYRHNARGDILEEQRQFGGKPEARLTYEYEYR